MTAIYTLILIMVAFVIEISPTWRSEKMWLEYSIFCVLMYAVAVAYFLYLYLFVLYPNVINSCIYYLFKKATPRRWLLDEPVFNGEGAGTMYLRVGALCRFRIKYPVFSKFNILSLRVDGKCALGN